MQSVILTARLNGPKHKHSATQRIIIHISLKGTEFPFGLFERRLNSRSPLNTVATMQAYT